MQKKVRNRCRGFLLALTFAVLSITTLGLLLASQGQMVYAQSQSDAAHHEHMAIQSTSSTDLVTSPQSVQGDVSTLLFQADLLPENEGNAPESLATGRVVLSLTGNDGFLRILTSEIDNVSMAHIHTGTIGNNGPPIVTIYNRATDGDVSANPVLTATFTLSAEQIDALQTGGLYVNVHSDDFPGGEIRGQLRPYTPLSNFHALLLGENERPTPVTSTTASGLAIFSMATLGTLDYQLHATDIVSITAAHIHRGSVDSAGGVLVGLYAGGGSFEPGSPVTGTVNLNGESLVDLLTGQLYVNIHTDANKGGEIRGQIGGASLFEAALSGAQEVPPVSTIASGKAVMALDADGSTLYYRLLVEDIENVSAAHIHRAPVGQVGNPPLFPLTNVSETLAVGSPVSGSIALSPENVLDLLGGNYYVNVHTPLHPSGEMRGQLMAMVAPATLNATLTGAQQVPAIETTAVGLARFRLNDLLDHVLFSVVVTDINDIKAAHVHLGAMGENGGIRYDVYKAGQTEELSEVDPLGGGAALSAKDWVDMLTGYHYINVHTGAHGSGEIRGQIGGVRTYWSKLNGANASTAITTTASGMAVWALNNDATELAYRLFVNDIGEITMAHIHRGAAGVDGGVAVGLYAGSGSFDSSSPLSGTVALSTPDVLRLIAGTLYVNVHTVAHGSGEIRDQLHSYDAPSEFVAILSGAAERPNPVTTDASGMAHLRLLPEMNNLSVSVMITNIVDVRAAHIHVGSSEVAGPVVYPLFSAANGGTFDANNPVGVCVPIDSKGVVDILTGYYYINVHTTANLGGEIRGQVGEPTPNVYLPLVSKE